MKNLVTKREVERLGYIFKVWVVVACMSWFAFLFYGYPILNSLFEVVSALTDAGLSTGIINQLLPAPLKLVIMVDMLFGKFTIIGLLLLSLPNLLHKRKEPRDKKQEQKEQNLKEL